MVESIQHGMADLAMHSTTRINVRTLHRINEKKSSILNTCHARLDVFRRILLRCEHFIFLHHDDVSVSLRGKSIHELYSRIRRRQLDVRSVRSLSSLTYWKHSLVSIIFSCHIHLLVTIRLEHSRISTLEHHARTQVLWGALLRCTKCYGILYESQSRDTSFHVDIYGS